MGSRRHVEGLPAPAALGSQIQSCAGSSARRSPLTACSLTEKMESVNEGMHFEWGTRAIRDMRRLATRDRERIIAKIEQYAENPASLARQVTALTGSDYQRLRVGHHRVIFSTQLGEPSVESQEVVLRGRGSGVKWTPSSGQR